MEDDCPEQDQHEERLRELFNSFDGDGCGALTPEELDELLRALQLDEATPALLHALLQNVDENQTRVQFEQFRDALILVLSSTFSAAQEEPETEPRPESPEIQPKFVKGSKRYGRRSTPELLDPAADPGDHPRTSPAHGGDLDDNYDSAVPRKRERWNSRDTSVEEYEAEGQMHLWNPDEPTTPRKSGVPSAGRLEERLQEACEELQVVWDGCATEGELRALCEHLGLELSEDVLLGLSNNGQMSVQEFVSRVIDQHKPPTPSASTPYRQLKRNHSTQPFDDAGRRISALNSTIGMRLFSTLDDGTGHTPAEYILDAWGDEGVENSTEILQALNFELDGKLNLGDLTSALESELLVTKNAIHQAALASFRAEIRSLMERVDQEIREKEKIRSDLEKAEKQKSLFAAEVDEHHSAIEQANNLKLRKLEQEHKEKLAAARSELTRETEQIQHQASLQREELEAEVARIREDETLLREHLSMSLKENRRLEMDLLDSAEKLAEAQSQITKLQMSLDHITKEKFGDLDPSSADFLLQDERVKQLRSSYEAQCRELQDRIDELQSELREFEALGRVHELPHKSLSEEMESKSPGTDSDPGLGSDEVQPFSMSLEAEMMLERLKEQHLQEMEDLQNQLESKVRECNQRLEEQQETHEQQKAALTLRLQQEVRALRQEVASRQLLQEDPTPAQEELHSQLGDETQHLRQELLDARNDCARLQEQLKNMDEEEVKLMEKMEALRERHTREMSQLKKEQEEVLHSRLTEEREQLQEEKRELERRMILEWERERVEIEESHENRLREELEKVKEEFKEDKELALRSLMEQWVEERAELDRHSNESLQALLEEEMLRLVREQDEKEAGLKEEWQRERVLLQEEKLQLQEERDKLQKEKLQLQEEKDKLQEEKDKLQERYNLILEEQDHLQGLHKQILEEKLKLQEKYEQQKKLWEEEKLKLQEEVERQEEKQKEWENEKQQLQEENKRREEKLRREWEEEKLQLQEEYGGMVLERVKEEKARLEREKDELEEQTAVEREHLEEQHRAALKELSSRHSEERRELSAELERLRGEVAQERQEVESVFSQRIKDVEQRLSCDQESVASRFQTAISKLEQRYERELSALSERHEQQKVELQRATEQQRIKAEEAREQEKEELTQEWKKEREDLETVHRREKKALEEEVKRLQHELEETTCAAESKEIELKRELNELHRLLQQKMDLLAESQHKALQAERLLSRTAQDFREEHAELLSNTYRLEEELKEAQQLLQERERLKLKVEELETLLRQAAEDFRVEREELRGELSALLEAEERRTEWEERKTSGQVLTPDEDEEASDSSGCEEEPPNPEVNWSCYQDGGGGARGYEHEEPGPELRVCGETSCDAKPHSAALSPAPTADCVQRGNSSLRCEEHHEDVVTAVTLEETADPTDETLHSHPHDPDSDSDCENMEESLQQLRSACAAGRQQNLLLQQKVSLLQQKTGILENLLAHESGRARAARHILEENCGLKLQLLLLMQQVRALEAEALTAAALQARHQDCAQQNSRLQEQNAELKERLRSLGEEELIKEESGESLNPLQEEYGSLEESCRSFEAKNSKVRRGIPKLQEEPLSLDQRTRAQRAEASRLAQENLLLNNKIAALRDADRKRDELVETLELLKREKSAAQKTADRFQKQVSELREENGALSQRNADSLCDVESLQRQLEELQRESTRRDATAEEKTQMAACVSALESELTRALDDTAQLEERNIQMSQQLHQLREKAARADVMESRLTEERQSAEEEAAGLRSQLLKAQEKVKVADESLQCVGRQSARLKTDLRLLQKERDSLKQELTALHRKLQSSSGGVLEASRRSGQSKHFLRNDPEQQQETERLLPESQGVRKDLLRPREKVRQLDRRRASLSSALKDTEPDQSSIQAKGEQASECAASAADLERLQQENEALRNRMASLSSQLMEKYHVQFVELLPPSPHRLPRGHRADDPVNLDERRMRMVSERMQEVELSLHNVKLLLKEKVAQLKDQLHKNGKADALIKDLYVENSQLVKALEITEQRQKLAEKKNYLLEEKISSLNQAVRDLGTSAAPALPYGCK